MHHTSLKRKNTSMTSSMFTKIRLALIVSICVAIVPHLFAQRSSSYYGGSSYGGYRSGGGGSSSSSASTSREYQNNTMIGDAVFSIDPETRRVIVITDDETAAHVSQVISNLDQPKPQVLIKVVFLEVTYNNGLDIGVEGGIKKNLNASTTLSASNLFGLAQQGIAPGAATTVPGAGIYQVVGNDFNATLRAIAEAGKVEVLSRPSILTRNNQQANIVVGQQVPLITGANYDTFGNLHNSITYQNVGIILQVTPFIAADGLVEMIVAPQISQVDANQSVQISTSTNGVGVNAPVIDIRSANTVVVTPNGQTVVIGGLMKNSKNSTISKIPLLGDIPLLGALFRHKTSQDAKTELMIFLTPYVVKTPSDLSALARMETGRTELAPKAFTEKELDKFLDGVPMRPQPAPVIVPTNAPPASTPATYNNGTPKNH